MSHHVQFDKLVQMTGSWQASNGTIFKAKQVLCYNCNNKLEYVLQANSAVGRKKN